ncbi:hypothetical protein KR059_006002 [Drosophila kikkawai]|nr:hypothetical protein KR059_006002 [Drosophila kikkawai]
MRSAIIPSLILLIFWLSGSANGKCHGVHWPLHLTFSIGNGSCEEVGGEGEPDSCSINICADGNPLRGSYCNRCLNGDWIESFLDRNSWYTITVLHLQWITGH